MLTIEFRFNSYAKTVCKQINTMSPYLEKKDLNTVNLKGTDPLQSAALSNLKPASYKNQLQGQDVVQPKSTSHKVRP